MKPWHDAPRCPESDCGARCGTRVGESIAPGDLRCACCGNDWAATLSELDQARKADAAWEAEQARQESKS